MARISRCRRSTSATISLVLSRISPNTRPSNSPNTRPSNSRKGITVMSTAQKAAVSLDSLIERAKAAERAGDWTDALEHYEAAFALLPSEGDARKTAEVLRWIGAVHR